MNYYLKTLHPVEYFIILHYSIKLVLELYS